MELDSSMIRLSISGLLTSTSLLEKRKVLLELLGCQSRNALAQQKRDNLARPNRERPTAFE